MRKLGRRVAFSNQGSYNKVPGRRRSAGSGGPKIMINRSTHLLGPKLEKSLSFSLFQVTVWTPALIQVLGAKNRAFAFDRGQSKRERLCFG